MTYVVLIANDWDVTKTTLPTVSPAVSTRNATTKVAHAPAVQCNVLLMQKKTT